MQDPVADVLVLDEVEDLGLVDVAGVSPGMEDAVGVYGKILAVAFFNALLETAPDSL